MIKKIFAKLSLGQEVPEKFFESMDITDADTLQNVQNRDMEHNNVNLSQDCSGMPKQDNTELHAKHSAVLQKLDNNFKRLIQMVSEDCSPDVTNSLIKLNNVFDKMQTPAQLTAFCYSAAKNRCPRQIGVQPGSISRRKIRPGLTSGAKRIQAGRPSTQEQLLASHNSKKRKKRNLAENVSENKPNAKSHGHS